jgi:hypothetical protein
MCSTTAWTYGQRPGNKDNVMKMGAIMHFIEHFGYFGTINFLGANKVLYVVALSNREN